MKRKEESMSRGHYAGYFVRVLLLLCGMVFLFTSCENETIPEKGKKSGKQIPVSVHIAGITEGGTEAIRASGREEEILTQTVSLGDGMLLEMRLAPDPASLLRGTTPLGNGKKFRVIAVMHSDHTYVSHGDFTVGSGTHTLSSFTVQSGENYDFICVSLNSADSVPYTTGLSTGEVPSFLTSPIDGADLLYDGTSHVNKTINSDTDAELSFTLSHKFSEVTLAADCSYNEWNISAVSNTLYLAPFYTVSMNYAGNVTKQGDALTNAYFTWNPIITPSPTATSQSRMVYTAGEAISVVIPAASFTIHDKSMPPSQTTATFNGKTLEAGKKYTLTLKFKMPKFASSNIYWDAVGQKLTFKPYDLNPGTIYPTEQQYQGVFFKWGSLIGISPALTNNVTDQTQFHSGTNMSPNQGTDGTLIYVPTYNPLNMSFSSWTKTNLSTFTNGRVANLTFAYPAWDSIPYAGDTGYAGYASARWPYVNYTPPTDWNTSELTDLSTTHYTDYVGDICSYISQTQAIMDYSGSTRGFYRLPRCEEFGPFPDDNDWTVIPVVNGWTKVPAADWTDMFNYDEHGTYLISNGGKFSATANFFPASGYRSGPQLVDSGSWVTYQTSTVVDMIYNYTFALDNVYVVPTSLAFRYYGGSVRCVLEDGTD
ncbi:MAG: hypothetical protein LBS46_05640 [Dysgonamonadaceae bacterium]|jgi:hypothetical protein|nr:hypothetical protein [Dysgonamonadaceae bacterium]